MLRVRSRGIIRSSLLMRSRYFILRGKGLWEALTIVIVVAKIEECSAFGAISDCRCQASSSERSAHTNMSVASNGLNC